MESEVLEASDHIALPTSTPADFFTGCCYCLVGLRIDR